jgi:hypothetical protein
LRFEVGNATITREPMAVEYLCHQMKHSLIKIHSTSQLHNE